MQTTTSASLKRLQQEPCAAVAILPTEEEPTSDTSGSDTTVVVAASLQRLETPEAVLTAGPTGTAAASGSRRVVDGGACWKSGNLLQPSIHPPALDAAAVAAALGGGPLVSQQQHQQQPQQQYQPQASSAAAAAAADGWRAEEPLAYQQAAAAGCLPPALMHLQERQHSSSSSSHHFPPQQLAHQLQQQQQLLHASNGDQPLQLQQLLARYSQLQQHVSSMDPDGRQQQQSLPPGRPPAHARPMGQQHHPQLPPLPGPRQQQQQQQPKQWPRPQPLQAPAGQQQQVVPPPCPHMFCRECQPPYPCWCEPCHHSQHRQQQQHSALPPTGTGPPSGVHHAPQQGGYWSSEQQQIGMMVSRQAGQQQRQQQQQAQQQQQQHYASRAAPGSTQHLQAGNFVNHSLQQQTGRQTARQFNQQQPQQPRPHNQHQRLYTVPVADRPWGWWREPGHSSLLLHLDGVRPPLLQLHTALGGTHSSPELLAAMGRSSSGGGGGGHQQQQPGAVGEALVECWQHLLAVEQARQQMVSSPRQQQVNSIRQLQAASGAEAAAVAQQQQHQAVQPCPALPARAAAAAGEPADMAAEAETAAEAAERKASAAAAAAARKGPKRPWQPKMQPDEPNWDKAAFTDVQARCSQVAVSGKGSKWPRTLPEHSTATFAQLMLLHQAGWPNHLMWEHWQDAHAPGSLTMFVHMKAGVNLTHGMPGRDTIVKHKLKTSMDSRWGDISLVEAQLHSMAEILKRCPHVTHIGLASGHDVPVQLIRPDLLLPGVSLFGMYQFGPIEMRTLKVAVVDELTENSSMTEEEAQSWGRALTFHHQWMVLSREHAAALVLNMREIVVVGRLLHKACCSVRAGMAPDEFIIITALKQRGFVRSIQRVEVKPGMRYPPGCLLNSYPTFVVFPAEASPHPVLWTRPDEKVRCQVEKNTGQQYHTMLSLNDCLDLAVERSAIFFRKIEIRQTCGEELVMLLSSLSAMWEGKRKGSSAAINKTSSGSNGNGNGGGGGNKRRGSKRKNSPFPSNSTAAQTSQDADAQEASSAAAVSQDLTAMDNSTAPPPPPQKKTCAPDQAAIC